MNPNYLLVLGAHDEYMLIDALDCKQEIKELIHNLEEQSSDEGLYLDTTTLEEVLIDKFPDIRYYYFDLDDDIIEL